VIEKLYTLSLTSKLYLHGKILIVREAVVFCRLKKVNLCNGYISIDVKPNTSLDYTVFKLRLNTSNLQLKQKYTNYRCLVYLAKILRYCTGGFALRQTSSARRYL